MIKSFKCKDTERLFNDAPVCKWAAIERPVRRKLQLLHVAGTLQDLTIPPGNRLEALSGARKGQHSSRVNDQWRICLVWRDLAAYNVELIDYH